MSLPAVIIAGPWWGRAIGTGVGILIGGWPGGVLGFLLGYVFDDRLRMEPYSSRTWRGCGLSRAEHEFFTATFSVMGHVAKADGRVSTKEVEVTEKVMARFGLEELRRQRAIYLFTRGKRRDFPMRAVLRRFRNGAGRQPEILERFLRCLLDVAYADGPPSPQQERLLLIIALRLGVNPARLEELARARGGRADGKPQLTPPARTPLAEAYRLLGLSAAATDDEVRLAYRRAIGRHHPDRLVASGASEEELKAAHVRTQEIREAFEEICQARGL